MKCITSKINKNIDNLEDNKRNALRRDEWDNQKKGEEVAILNERIKELKRLKMKRSRDNTKTKFFIEGETLRKLWINANKAPIQHDIVVALKDESRPGKPLTRCSDTMSNLTRKYHDELQEKDPISDPREHRRNTKSVLRHIKVKLKEEQVKLMSTSITRKEVKAAIEDLPNRKAAGLDGILQEVWKSLLSTMKSERDTENDNEEDNREDREPTFDVANYLTILYNDIEDHGMVPDTNFVEGWLCPIYKKGDRTNIGNYRPITILNTDYKIYTKTIVNKLTKTTPDIIHLDQAGFMRGRCIEDQTELAHMVIVWREKKETNGMIVCLDQEKAYDKIRHAFLWVTLKKFGFPKKFINTV